MPRQRQQGMPRQSNVDPQLEELMILKQLGFLQDPNERNMGLVQLLNEMNKPEQFQQELGMKSRELDQRDAAAVQSGGQFERTFGLQQEGFNRQKSQDETLAQQFIDELAFKKTAQQQQKDYQDKVFNMEAKDKNLKGILGYIEAVTRSSGSVTPVESTVIAREIKNMNPNLAGLYTIAKQAQQFADPKRQLQYDTRLKLGLPPIPTE